MLFYCCFWIIPSSELLVCPGLYHFSGPDYAVSSSPLYIRSGVEAHPAGVRLGAEWVSIDTCPQATWVTRRKGVQITGGQGLSGESWELGMRGEVCVDPLLCSTLSPRWVQSLQPPSDRARDWIASLSHCTGEKTEASGD